MILFTPFWSRAIEILSMITQPQLYTIKNNDFGHRVFQVVGVFTPHVRTKGQMILVVYESQSG